MRTFSGTDTGRRRDMNQDYMYISETPVGNLPNLFILADGMGGHNAGDYASRYTVEVIVNAVRTSSEVSPVAVIRKAIVQANQAVMEKARTDIDLEGMGTTVVVATMQNRELCVANVGDSRLYVISDRIRQITQDHSLVEEMVRMGGIDRASARNHPDKNIITRAIGVKEGVEADIYEYRLKRGDVILMCTDGLSNMVEDEDMFNIVRGARDVVEAVQMLIEKANSNGGRDNIGVVIAEPLADEVSV